MENKVSKCGRIHRTANKVEHCAFEPEDWRASYLRRGVAENFWEEFFVMCDNSGLEEGMQCGCRLLKAESEQENEFDSSGGADTLIVFVKDGRICDIVIEYYSWWRTSSNWHDKHESRESVSYGIGTGKVIEDAGKVLDQCTKEWSSDYLFKLLRHMCKLLPDWKLERRRNEYGWALVCDDVEIEFNKGTERLIEYAYCLPEVFWGDGIKRDGENYWIEKNRGWIYWIEKNRRWITLALNFIDVNEFYDDRWKKRVQDECVERYKRNLQGYRVFMGLSERLFENMIKCRIDDLLDNKSRVEKGFAMLGERGAVRKDTDCKSLTFSERVVQRPAEIDLNVHFGCRTDLVYKLPDGALCFFDSRDNFVGFADRDCKVYAAKSGERIKGSFGRYSSPVKATYKGQLVGDEVLLDYGDKLAMFDSKGLSHKGVYFLWHDEHGAIYLNSKVVGYADVDMIEAEVGQWCGLYLLNFVKKEDIEMYLPSDQGWTTI